LPQHVRFFYEVDGFDGYMSAFNVTAEAGPRVRMQIRSVCPGFDGDEAIASQSGLAQ
jgi:hypothetical protein